ncbi:DUF58 domain-containing protein [Granulosicoccaceae sp. 1_MG-2023]|nr:DUF58 domain-containing protein [Granulosicoccaceae sp. 1_MG-2023]
MQRAARSAAWPPVLKKARQRFLRASARDALPLTISHERIYILPSRRGWMFALSLLVMLVASMNYLLNLGFALCFVLAGLFASSLLATYRNLAGLKFEAATADDTFAGQHACFVLQLHNPHGRARPGIRVSTAGGHEVYVSLPARTGVQASLNIPATERGRLPLGRLTISSDYPLGLWHGWCYVHTPCDALVYPAPEADAPAWPAHAQMRRKGFLQQGSEGEDNFDQLKNFRPGDPLSRVAWKTVARGQGWFSKSFEPEAASNKLIFNLADTRPAGNTEQRLSRLCAWILHAEREQRSYALQLPGYHSSSGRGPVHRDALLEQLALLEPHA